MESLPFIFTSCQLWGQPLRHRCQTYSFVHKTLYIKVFVIIVSDMMYEVLGKVSFSLWQLQYVYTAVRTRKCKHPHRILNSTQRCRPSGSFYSTRSHPPRSWRAGQSSESELECIPTSPLTSSNHPSTARFYSHCSFAGEASP